MATERENNCSVYRAEVAVLLEVVDKVAFVDEHEQSGPERV